MKKYSVRGGRELYGDVHISGMKNAALPIIFASILSRGRNIIYNLPQISDIQLSFEILTSLGAKIEELPDGGVAIDTSAVRSEAAPFEFVSKMRGSTYLIGAMLARFGEARVGLPGGCDFGQRPLDQHLKGFSALGAKIDYGHSGELMAEMIRYGMATIALSTTGSRQPGVRICVSQLNRPEQFDMLEERLRLFAADH